MTTNTLKTKTANTTPPAAQPQQPAAGASQRQRVVTAPRKKTRAPQSDEPITDKLGRPFPPLPGDALPAGGMSVDRGGRPYAIKDEAAAIQTCRGLGAIMATTKECAAVLGIGEKTLFRFFDRCPAARDAYESGKDEGKSSLRRIQFKLAEKNATMAIFLGMQYLEQKDRRAFVGDPAAPPIQHQHEHTVKPVLEHDDLDSLTTEELSRRYAELTAEAHAAAERERTSPAGVSRKGRRVH